MDEENARLLLFLRRNSRAFLFLKQTYEISPIASLVKRRIATATDYLLKTNMLVAEIARLVGYENTTHFTHLFIDRIGCTPSEFRDRNQKPMVFETIRHVHADRT